MVRFGIVAFAVAAILAAPAIAEAAPLHVGKLGIYGLGDKPPRIRARSRECSRSPDDCSFVELRTGVEYLVLRGAVLTARADASTAKTALPFRLAFGETLASARRKLPRPENWQTGREGSATWVANAPFSDKRDAKDEGFSIELHFVADHLTLVAYVGMV